MFGNKVTLQWDKTWHYSVLDCFQSAAWDCRGSLEQQCTKGRMLLSGICLQSMERRKNTSHLFGRQKRQGFCCCRSAKPLLAFTDETNRCRVFADLIVVLLDPTQKIKRVHNQLANYLCENI